MRKPQALKSIDIKAGKLGPMSHAVISNPHFVLHYYHAIKTSGLTQARFSAWIESALERGAKSMLLETPIPPGLFDIASGT